MKRSQPFLSRIRHPSKSEENLTFGQRAADAVARFGGSWIFVGLFMAILVAWMVLNERGLTFDPYPFILLNLVLSCIAALQAPIIMMSQNRQAARDREQSLADYEINKRALGAIEHIAVRLGVDLESWASHSLNDSKSCQQTSEQNS